MSSIKTLAIASLPMLALLAFPHAASARGGGFKTGGGPIQQQYTFGHNVVGNNVNTNLFSPPPQIPATALPKRRNSPRP